MEESGKEEEKKEEEKVTLFNKQPNKLVQTDTMVEYHDAYLKVIPVKLVSSLDKKKQCFSFIGIPAQAKGKFLPQKAKDLNLNPKVHYRILQEGNSVTLEDGTVVYPFQVIETPQPSQMFILMFIPDESYLDSVYSTVNKQKFKAFFDRKINRKTHEVMVMYHSMPL